MTTLIWAPVYSPYSGSKLLVRMRNSEIESRFGMTAVPSFMLSLMSLALNMNPFADSRWPLTDWCRDSGCRTEKMR